MAPGLEKVNPYLNNPICKTEKETQMYRTDVWTLWEKMRVGWSERTASKHVYYQVWNRSPVQVGCMRQVLGAGVLGWPRGMGWGGRREGGSGWGTHVNPWLIHVNVWQKPLQYCKVISLKLIKIIGEKKSLISIPKKGSTKEQTIALISHACKVMLKILHARLQNFQMSSFQMNLVQLPDEPGTSRCPSWD